VFCGQLTDPAGKDMLQSTVGRLVHPFERRRLAGSRFPL
jgi:hypothetical protein